MSYTVSFERITSPVLKAIAKFKLQTSNVKNLKSEEELISIISELEDLLVCMAKDPKNKGRNFWDFIIIVTSAYQDFHYQVQKLPLGSRSYNSIKCKVMRRVFDKFSQENVSLYDKLYLYREMFAEENEITYFKSQTKIENYKFDEGLKKEILGALVSEDIFTQTDVDGLSERMVELLCIYLTSTTMSGSMSMVELASRTLEALLIDSFISGCFNVDKLLGTYINEGSVDFSEDSGSLWDFDKHGEITMEQTLDKRNFIHSFCSRYTDSLSIYKSNFALNALQNKERFTVTDEEMTEMVKLLMSSVKVFHYSLSKNKKMIYYMMKAYTGIQIKSYAYFTDLVIISKDGKQHYTTRANVEITTKCIDVVQKQVEESLTTILKSIELNKRELNMLDSNLLSLLCENQPNNKKYKKALLESSLK